MNRKQRIHNLLKKKFKNFLINVQDNSNLHAGHNDLSGEAGTHLKIILINKNIAEINKLKIHRDIYSILKKEFENGLHALEIKIN